MVQEALHTSFVVANVKVRCRSVQVVALHDFCPLVVCVGEYSVIQLKQSKLASEVVVRLARVDVHYIDLFLSLCEQAVYQAGGES